MCDCYMAVLKLLIAQFLSELLPRKGKKSKTLPHWSVLIAQTSTYVVMGCSRPGQEYGGVCAIFIYITLVLTFIFKILVLTSKY